MSWPADWRPRHKPPAGRLTVIAASPDTKSLSHGNGFGGPIWSFRRPNEPTDSYPWAFGNARRHKPISMAGNLPPYGHTRRGQIASSDKQFGGPGGGNDLVLVREIRGHPESV